MRFESDFRFQVVLYIYLRICAGFMMNFVLLKDYAQSMRYTTWTISGFTLLPGYHLPQRFPLRFRKKYSSNRNQTSDVH